MTNCVTPPCVLVRNGFECADSTGAAGGAIPYLRHSPCLLGARSPGVATHCRTAIRPAPLHFMRRVLALCQPDGRVGARVCRRVRFRGRLLPGCVFGLNVCAQAAAALLHQRVSDICNGGAKRRAPGHPRAFVASTTKTQRRRRPRCETLHYTFMAGCLPRALSLRQLKVPRPRPNANVGSAWLPRLYCP